MNKLTDRDIGLLNLLLKYSPRLHNGYYIFQPRNKIFGNIKYKRSRVIMQLHLGRWLSIHEAIHHIDGDKTNDSISNLKLIDRSEHTSNHHAGLKKPRRKIKV